MGVLELAGDRPPGQPSIKYVSCPAGGQNYGFLGGCKFYFFIFLWGKNFFFFFVGQNIIEFFAKKIKIENRKKRPQSAQII